MIDHSTPPLFIVGAPRSGTSLVRNLIRACEGVYVPPDETQFLPAYFEKVASSTSTESLASFLDNTAFSAHMRARGIWPSRDELLTILRKPEPQSAIPTLMSYLAQREQWGAFAFWGDKTPRYVYFLDLFRSVFPGMRVLFVIRDPRDAVLSMREAWGRSLIRGSVAWRDAARIARSSIDSRNYSASRVVHYEALAMEPAGSMAGIAEWLGVDFSADSLDAVKGSEKWGAARGSGVLSTSIGRFRTQLSRTEIELIERVTFEEMRLWGYVPEYAVGSYVPSALHLQLARFADALRSLAKYGSERGFADGIGYKFRQFLTARRSPRR